MESIRIDDGAVRIMVNDDPNRVIAFRPRDLGFAERVYGLVQYYDQAEKEYQQRVAELEGGSDPAAEFALLREICEDAKSRIDGVFGAGTSAAAFGDMVDPSMFKQFFDGVTPFIEAARKPKMDKYTHKAKGGGVLRK